MKFFRYFFWCVSCFILVYIISVIIWSFNPEINHFLNKQEFDSELWINWEETENEPNLRWKMVDNLIKTEKVKGKTTEELIELLGEPNSVNSISLSYYLGMTGRGINTGSLRFEIKDGRVIDYAVWQG
jgi:hypothetical protein